MSNRPKRRPAKRRRSAVRRKWWDGLSDLERRQHRLKIARGVIENNLRRLSYLADDPWVRELRNTQAAHLLRLEAEEIEIGLRRLNS
jgi:hypothetical protein